MAVVNFYRTVPKSDGGFAPADGYLRFRQTAPRVITGTPDNTVLDSAFTMWLVNGLASPDLAQTTSAWAWEVEEHVTGKDVVTYVIQVPSGAGPFDEPDLTRLDPSSLTPAPEYSTVNERLTALEAGGGGGGAVSSVNSKTGDVVLNAADVGAAPASHTHNASDVNAGTLAVARLGSGTPAAGKYVDGGTGAWTALPAGGGSVPHPDAGGGNLAYPPGTSTSWGSYLTGRLLFFPMQAPGNGFTFTSCAVQVTTASGTSGSLLRISVYTLSTSGTFTKQQEFGTVATDTTGTKTITVGGTVPAGMVFLAFSSELATAQLNAAFQTGLFPVYYTGILRPNNNAAGGYATVTAGTHPASPTLVNDLSSWPCPRIDFGGVTLL